MTRRLARRLRNNPSLLDANAWKILRRLRDEGIHIRRQHPIGRYVVDFAIARARLAIEIDGGIHDLPEVAAADAERQRIIEQLGWSVLRLPGKLVSTPELLIDAVRLKLRDLPLQHREIQSKRAVLQQPDQWVTSTLRDFPHPLPPAPSGMVRRTREDRVLPPRRTITLEDRLLALIAQNGPITVAQYMTSALYDPLNGYYSMRAGLGAEGDFITAPEASQMFGELVGLWCAQAWMTLGSPAPFNLIELGPGNGTLIADAWRATRIVPGFHNAARISLVEVGAHLKARQAEALAKVGASATWIAHLDDAPDGPSLIIANEFLDCLPIRQFVRIDGGWREKLVGARDGKLAFGFAEDALLDDALIPPALRNAPDGAIAEVAPALPAFVDQIAQKLQRAPGRALIIDYGAAETTGGDTLQAVRAHRRVDVLDTPGSADLTAHVDFPRLCTLARDAGLAVDGPVAQGEWLDSLGVRERAAALAKARPDKADGIAAQLHRLTAPGEMGVLFNAVCLSPSDSPPPAGFTRMA